MSKQRNLSKIDKLIVQADHALRHLAGHKVHPARPSPAATEEETELEERQRKHIAGLMRINHTGEICAQALYQGQALTAHSEEIKTTMEISADEEVDHLAWCEERVEQMGSRTSHLNPLFYGMSFSIGAVAGLIGDKISLGFVAATENQVCKHLRDHLQQIPEQDKKSRAILELMLEDEARHASKALEAGGIEFPKPVKKVMTLMSKVMTTTTYRI